RSVILIDLFGGPSHIDTFDPKPDAPPEVRGAFRSIPTVLPGLRVAEHLPRLARQLHRTCLIRTVSHGYNSHNPYAVMTGYTGGSHGPHTRRSRPPPHPPPAVRSRSPHQGRRADATARAGIRPFDLAEGAKGLRPRRRAAGAARALRPRPVRLEHVAGAALGR